MCGGEACVRETRIPVWLLVLKRELGEPDVRVLGSYPGLTTEDLDAAWEYYGENPLEIQRSIGSTTRR